MDHGRDHENRQSHIRPSRANNTPPDPTTESEEAMIEGKDHASGSAENSDPTQRPRGGADVAPTKQAEERERERHNLEREIGRTPAGEEGRAREQRTPEATREALDEAAREADRRVAGHEISGSGKGQNK